MSVGLQGLAAADAAGELVLEVQVRVCLGRGLVHNHMQGQAMPGPPAPCCPHTPARRAGRGAAAALCVLLPCTQTRLCTRPPRSPPNPLPTAPMPPHPQEYYGDYVAVDPHHFVVPVPRHESLYTAAAPGRPAPPDLEPVDRCVQVGGAGGG